MKLAFLSFLFATSACFAQPGALDLSFNPGSGTGGGETYVSAMCLMSNGEILVAGEFTTFNGFPRHYVARLNSDGSLDQTFDPGTGPNNFPSVVVVQTNEMVLIAGQFQVVNGLYQPFVARLRADGSLDPTFTNIANGGVYALANLNNGGFLAAGSFTTVNGTTMHNVACFNANGSLDPSFSPGVISNNAGGSEDVHAIAVQPNGFVVIGGDFTSVGGQSCQCLARLNSSGAVDTTFVGPGSIGGASYPVITSILLESNGQMVVGGNFSSINGYAELGVARLNSDGTLDTSFRALPNGSGTAPPLAVQSNGKILIGEYNSTVLERLNTDGSQDTTLSVTLPGSFDLQALAVQTDGKILMAGGLFPAGNGTYLNSIARLLGDSASQAGVQLLNMNLYPGMFLSGSIGTKYRIEYTTSLIPPSLWTPLTNLTLTNSPTFVADPTLPQGSRFYRAVTLP
jgi:uncharacterized delta-60 repeat protein